MDGPSRRPRKSCRKEGSFAQQNPKAGCTFFGYFSLCTQRKVTRRRLRTRIQALNSELKASSKRLNQAALLGQPSQLPIRIKGNHRDHKL